MRDQETSTQTPRTNREIADRFIEAAGLLEWQDANRFRVDAYISAANTLIDMERDVAEIVRNGGRQSLVEIPTIGDALAEAIVQIVKTGRWGFLDRLREGLDPIDVFQTVPGIGPVLAERIHETTKVETLEELEVAANEGRLDDVKGIGRQRAAVIRTVLGGMLRGLRGVRSRGVRKEPEVSTILDVDSEYRRMAAAGELPKIAPRRHNPDSKRWLPVFRTRRGPWIFTAGFSNSARAHVLDRTGDWVVVQFRHDDGDAGRMTVVTERRGPMVSKRVIRGREFECAKHHGVETIE